MVLATQEWQYNAYEYDGWRRPKCIKYYPNNILNADFFLNKNKSFAIWVYFSVYTYSLICIYCS